MHFKHLEGVFAVIILLTDTLLQTTEFQLFNSLKTKYQHYCTVEKLTVSLICSFLNEHVKDKSPHPVIYQYGSNFAIILHKKTNECPSLT